MFKGLFSVPKRALFLCLSAMLFISTLPTKKAVAFDGEIWRFHVIANSNSDFDQKLKLKVRDRILQVSESFIKEAENAENAELLAIENLTLLREVALDIVQEEGYFYDIKVSAQVCYFPEKTYGSITLPPGNYNAVRVVIGEGKGENWWCVMYPPLCFVNETADFPKESMNRLSTETKKQICKAPEIQIKWKIKELAKGEP